MNKHELNMQIYDIERGTDYVWHMLAFVFSTLISRTLVALLSPEGFIMKVKILSFRNIDITQQTVNYLISN